MKNLFKLSIIFLAVILPGCSNSQESKIIWQIGVHDNSASELALAPDKYNDFLTHDFGWEDRFYLIGESSPEKDFPYILPGPADEWGGTSNTAGLRTHVLNILFRMKSVPDRGDWKLILDILDTNKDRPPYFKVTVNGQSWKYILPNGGGDEVLGGDYGKCIKHTIEILLYSGFVKKGGNEINLTNLEGSWLVFDDVRLEGPGNAKLDNDVHSAYLRRVEVADYQLPEVSAQPLLVDLEYLSGNPLVEVKVDNKTILKQTLEQGRYVLEAPMPVVSKEQESKYSVFIDGQTVEKGTIIRSPKPDVTVADYIDTRMGTAHSRWMIAPGPWMPFSMVKLSPDNQNPGWQAGYQPSFESVGTFSHIHEWTMAGLGIMPTNGALKTTIGDQSVFKKTDKDYRSEIDKSSEEAGVGYYKVQLTDYNIKAELTATTRCGFQRYTYPAAVDSRVMIDLKIPAEYGYNILDAKITQVNERRIEGYSKQQSKNIWSTDSDQDYTVYFVIEFDQDISKFGGWINENILDKADLSAKNPNNMGCFAEFDTRQNPIVQVRSAISYGDMEGARRNLQEEIANPFGWNFDHIRDFHRKEWNGILSRINVQSNDRREKIRFYTNMYRSYCRNTFSDVDGRWVDATEKIQKFDDPDALALGCDAFWNTFWNLNQVWNLITPEWSSRWVKSQLGMYDANGWLAKGPAGMEYVPVMVAEHEIPLLVSAYQMGIRNFDVEKVFAAAKKMQTTPAQHIGNGLAGNRDLTSYLKYKYVPADKGRFSNSLEYSFDDWTVSQLAKALGKEKDYEIFSDRGNWWRNVIDTETGYARMRYSNGEWEKDFDPFKSGANHHYVEGNAWQLTFFVPQDVPALANMIGRDHFIERLTWGFEASEPWRYNAPGDQYWDFPVVQGNQQSMHFAFLFNWVGQPWQTQKWSRSIIDRYYGHEVANAYLGDEDQGQMSAWFVMAALGLFQTDGGCSVDPVYEIGSPLFEKTTINLGERFGRGTQFDIIAKGASRTNKYVQSAKLNGRELNSFCFPARELLKGGTLELQMGAEPNKQWGLDEGIKDK
ncbi:GH92 family glycosyl hydrolase [Dysgonomonas sp. Marseille-P4677]|uniref:GH92 family glycosyl hydrolase n=1 Tax=Dysgonomonas sp. Marseille-P4677 TaxID=2364790 RepID=UPI0019124903|nr:GH92 family glycosyl hydrolase [Dysgonomonas sp. Marseille-P4677]MBK5720913.1 GH92 family glycosyl hydrolase [Dysgonomonas sp. Marseille-P4677]